MVPLIRDNWNCEGLTPSPISTTNRNKHPSLCSISEGCSLCAHNNHKAPPSHTYTPGHKPHHPLTTNGNRDNQAPPRAHTRLRSSRVTKQLGALAYGYSCTGASSTLTAHKNLATYHHAAVTQNQTAAGATTSRQRSCHPSVRNTTPQNTVTGSTTTTVLTYNRNISPTQRHKPLTTI